MRDDRVAVADGEDDVGVAGVDREQHQRAPSKKHFAGGDAGQARVSCAAEARRRDPDLRTRPSISRSASRARIGAPRPDARSSQEASARAKPWRRQAPYHAAKRAARLRERIVGDRRRGRLRQLTEIAGVSVPSGWCARLMPMPMASSVAVRRVSSRMPRPCGRRAARRSAISGVTRAAGAYDGDHIGGGEAAAKPSCAAVACGGAAAAASRRDCRAREIQELPRRPRPFDLLARGDPERAGVARGGEAARFLVGGIEFVEADEPNPVRPSFGERHGKSDAAAAPAAVISGAAPRRKNSVNTPARGDDAGEARAHVVLERPVRVRRNT